MFRSTSSAFDVYLDVYARVRSGSSLSGLDLTTADNISMTTEQRLAAAFAVADVKNSKEPRAEGDLATAINGHRVPKKP